MYIINGKSVTGPNPGHLASATDQITHFEYPGGNEAADAASRASNQYQFQLERASLVSAPVPGRHDLDKLTEQVARNNFYNDRDQPARRAGHAVPQRAHQARHLRREGEPDVRPGARRPDQRRQGRPQPGPVRPGPHAELPQALHGVRDARQLHEPRRRQHGRLVMDDAGARDQDGDDHAADQLRRREPRSLLRVGGHQSRRAGELGHRGAARRGRGACGHDQLQHSLGEPAWRHGEPVDRGPQPRIDRRAVRHGGRLHLQCGAERRQDRPQLRLPREQHRQHRHDGRRP